MGETKCTGDISSSIGQTKQPGQMKYLVGDWDMFEVQSAKGYEYCMMSAKHDSSPVVVLLIAPTSYAGTSYVPGRWLARTCLTYFTSPHLALKRIRSSTCGLIIALKPVA